MSTMYLNFSYRRDGKTKEMIDAIIKSGRFNEHSSAEYQMINDVYNVNEVSACYNCSNKFCKKGFQHCPLGGESFQGRYEVMKMYNNIVFCTPVYFNLPTPKFLSFISRFGVYNDTVANRALFADKTAYIACVGDVSGTQQCASVMMNALNMLGFNFRGKCVIERVNEWNSGKVRGGFLTEEVPWIGEKNV